MSRTRSILGGMAAIGALAGCASQVNNPFRDDGALLRPELTTPSAEVYRAGPLSDVPQDRRAWDRSNVQYHNIGVTHWPIWWEDPFIDKGNEPTDPINRDAPDLGFAVTGVDFLAIPYGYARLVLNTLAWPVSAVAAPPRTVMMSDGRLSRGCLGFDHDAARSTPMAEPPFAVSRDDVASPGTPADAMEPFPKNGE